MSDDAPATVVTVDATIYGLVPVLKAVYRLTDRAYVHLQRTDESKLEVWLRAKAANVDPASFAGEFENSLIDEALRERVATETRAERDLIIAHALSRTDLLAGM